MSGIIQSNTVGNDSQAFFQQYASLLRVQTNIGDLCQAKNEASSTLPKMPSQLRNQRRHSENPTDISLFARNVSRNYLLAHTNEELHQIAIKNHSSFNQQKKRISDLLSRDQSNLMAQGLQSEFFVKSFGQKSKSVNPSVLEIGQGINQYSTVHLTPFESRIRKNISQSRLAFANSNIANGHIDFQSDEQWKEVVSDLQKMVDQEESMQQLKGIPRFKKTSNQPKVQSSPDFRVSLLHDYSSSLQSPLSNRDMLLISKIKQNEIIRQLSLKERSQNLVVGFQSKVFQPSSDQEDPSKSSNTTSHHSKELTQIEIQTQKALDSLQETNVRSLHQRAENARVQKRFYDKLDGANNRMLDLIFTQNQEFENNEQILDFKKQLQKSRHTYLGFKDFTQIKAAFYEKLARKNEVERQRQKQTLLSNLLDQTSGGNTDNKSTVSRQLTIQSSQYNTNRDIDESKSYGPETTGKSSFRADTEIADPTPKNRRGGNTSDLESVRSKNTIWNQPNKSPSHKSNHLIVDDKSEHSGPNLPLSAFKLKIQGKPILMVDAGIVSLDVSQKHGSVPVSATIKLTSKLQLHENDSTSYLHSDSSLKDVVVPQIYTHGLELDLETLKSENVQQLEHHLASKESKPTFIQHAVANKLKGYPESMVAFYSETLQGTHAVPSYFQSRQSYSNILKSRSARDFKTNFTDLTKQQENPINLYPILQQLSQGRFVIKSQKYEKGQMLELLNLTKSLVKPLSFVMIDQCDMDDEELASIVRIVANDELILDLCLIRLVIGPATIQALVFMQKKQNQLVSQHINIRQCKFTGYVSEPLNYYHPFLTPSFLQLHLLSLSDLGLGGIDLELITKRIATLKHLDISYNRFTAKEMLTFLTAINTQYRHCELTSLSIGGNSLNSDSPNAMLIQLKNLVIKPHIQHLDLSETNLGVDMLHEVMVQLKEARTLVSFHLSFSQAIRNAAKTVLQDLLFDQMTTKPPQEEISSEWFKYPHVPHLQTDDITMQVSRQLIGAPSKYVLSRIIGRKDLDNGIRLTTVPQKWEYDFIEESDSQKREQMVKRRHLEHCWVESEDCWVCQRWNYILPLVCRSEIEECMSTEVQKFALSASENHTLERLIKINKKDYDSMELRQMYIIGALTNNQFVKLDTLAAYMTAIDPESNIMLAETKGDTDQLYQYYRQNFRKVLPQKFAPTYINLSPSQLYQKTKFAEKTHPLFPYQPVLTRLDPESVSENFGVYDVVFTKSFLAKPGLVEFFLVYKMDQTRIFKSLQTSFVPIRSFPIHTYTIPKMEKKQKIVLTQEEREDNYYFNVFKQWRQDDAKRLRFLFEQDVRLWKVQSGPAEIPELSTIADQCEYRDLLEAIQLNIQQVMVSFRTLLAESTSYPLLNWAQIREWVEAKLQFVDDVFTIDVLRGTFKSVKQFQLNRNKKTDFGAGKESKVARFKSYKKIKHTVNNEPDNELTRFMFLEFLVRISFSKYKFSGGKKAVQGQQSMESNQMMRPTDCFKRFVREVLEYWNVKQQKVEISTFNQENFRTVEIFGNRIVQKMIFLNHFSLAEIYRRFLKEYEAENPEIEEQRQFRKQNYVGETSVLERRNKEEAHIFKSEQKSPLQETTLETAQQTGAISTKAIRNKPQTKTSLKKVGTKKVYKDLKLSVKSEFLNVNGAPIIGIHKDFILQKFLQLQLSPEQQGLLSSNIFLNYYASSKMSQSATGNSRQVVEQDIQRADKMLFIEFLVLVCFVAEMLFKNEEDRGQRIPYWQKCDKFLRLLLASQGYQLKEIPINDTRGDTEVKEIKIKGKMQTFVPPTPFSQREDIFPNQYAASEYGEN